MRNKSSKIESVPVLSFDVDDPFAWMRVVAGLVWGGNTRKMDYALATYSAELAAILRDVSAQPVPPLTVGELSRQLGVTVEDIARMPGAVDFYGAFFSKPVSTSQHLMRTVFEPSGHFRAVAQAPGSEVLLTDFARAVQGGAFLAGLMLMLVAILARRHPDVPASLNRALAVMRGWSERRMMRLPTDRTLMAMWKEWRHLAPLWAALTAAHQNPAWPALPPRSATLEVLHDPTRLKNMLGVGKWFRTFATTFVPEHAGTPLIPSHIPVQIIGAVPEIVPNLAELRPADIEALRRYRAPTRKFNDY